MHGGPVKGPRISQVTSPGQTHTLFICIICNDDGPRIHHSCSHTDCHVEFSKVVFSLHISLLQLHLELSDPLKVGRKNKFAYVIHPVKYTEFFVIKAGQEPADGKTACSYLQHNTITENNTQPNSSTLLNSSQWGYKEGGSTSLPTP